MEPGSAHARRLHALGLSAEAEAAYVRLLADGTVPDPALASELRALGLLHTVADVDVPASIEGVLGSWAAARAAEETATRAAASELAALYDAYADRSAPQSVVRLLRGRDDVIRAAESLGAEASESIEEFTRAPFLSGPEGGMPQEQPSAAERGVAYRVVYESSLLTRPTIVQTVQDSIALGEDARVATALPLRLLIADRRRALVVLPHPALEGNDLSAADADGLLVESSSMLDALLRLFDQVWEQAAPLKVPADAPDRPDADRELLLTLLSVGMTDAAIARNLGISERTVHRRVAALAAQYGVVSRFQLGAVLERRGLLPGAADPGQPT